MKRGLIIGGFIVILLVGVAALYLTFFYNETCEDESCYKAALGECRKTVYVSDGRDAVWEYKILGKKKGECFVNAKLLILREGENDMKKLEGEEMVCSQELGVTSDPTSNLNNCHGLLKEYIQEVMIERMHLYVVENLDVVSGELNNII